MSTLTWQPSPFITNSVPGTLPDVAEGIIGKIDARGEDAVVLQAEVVGGGYILCDIYIWNGSRYVNTLCDVRLDAAYPMSDLPGGVVYAIWVASTVGTVTSWSVRYGLETE